MPGLASQRSSARRMNASSRSRIASDADGGLEPEHEARADRLHDGGRAALLAVLDVGQVDVLDGVDVGDRAAARHRRHPVAEQLPARDQHARRPGPADELVGRDEHRVLGRERVAGGVHLDRHVRRRRREVEEGQRPVLVEEARDPARVGHDPGHVRGRRERPDLQRPVRVSLQLLAQHGEVDVALAVLADHHHVRDGLAPGQLVAVVLVRADEHDRPLVRRDPRAQVPAVVEVRRDAQVEHVHEPVDRRGGARSRRRSPRGAPGPRRRPRGRGAVPPRGSATSGGPCRTTRCGCSRTAAGRPRGCSPRGTRGSGPTPCSPRR